MDAAVRAARNAAIGIAFNAACLSDRYRDESAWTSDTITCQVQSFVKELVEAERAVHAVNDALLKSKPSVQPVRCGDVVAETAHHVACRFARRVASAFGWPQHKILGCDLEHDFFYTYWEEIQQALASINLIDFAELEAAIKVEAAQATTIQIDDDALLSASRLAGLSDTNPDALRKKLERFRRASLDGWIENTERAVTDCRYLYRYGAVKHLLQK